MNGAVEEYGVVEIGNLAVEPEVNAGDGRGFEVADLFAKRRAFWDLRKDTVEIIEGQREDEIVEGLFRICISIFFLSL